MSLDLTAAASVLKETYPNGIVEIDYKRTKTLALLRKQKGSLVETNFGTAFKQPIKYSNPQAGSGTYATGYNQAATESTRYTNWYLTPGEMFQFARVAGQTIRRTGSTASFINALVSEIENAKRAATRMLEIQLDGTGWGDLGTIGSISGTTVTLTSAWMARFFEIGMTICASSSVNAAVLKNPTAGKTTKITARDTAAGTITTADDMSTGGTPWAAADSLFRSGDRQDSASPTRIVPCGFTAFCPDLSTDLSTNFFSVNQTLTNRLGGIRRVGSGNIEESLLDLSADIDAEGGQSTHCVMGSITFNRLCKSMVNRGEVDLEDSEGVKLGFKGVVIRGASGDIICYGDSAFRETRGRMFDVSEISILHTLDDLVKLEETDGLQFREIAGTDDWMARLVVSHQFCAEAPGHVGVVTSL